MQSWGLTRLGKVWATLDIMYGAGRAFATRCLSPHGLHELKQAALSLSQMRKFSQRAAPNYMGSHLAKTLAIIFKISGPFLHT